MTHFNKLLASIFLTLSLVCVVAGLIFEYPALLFWGLILTLFLIVMVYLHFRTFKSHILLLEEIHDDIMPLLKSASKVDKFNMAEVFANQLDLSKETSTNLKQAALLMLYKEMDLENECQNKIQLLDWSTANKILKKTPFEFNEFHHRIPIESRILAIIRTTCYFLENPTQDLTKNLTRALAGRELDPDLVSIFKTKVLPQFI